MKNLLEETLNSEISNYIPNNIKSNIIDIKNYEDTKNFLIIKNKNFTLCDVHLEQITFYKNCLLQLNECYKPLLIKYPFLKKNFEKQENLIKEKITYYSNGKFK